MANELTVTGALSYTNSAAPLYKALMSRSGTVDATGKKVSSGSWSVGASEENLPKGDIGTIGFVILKNLHATITATFGTVTSQLPITVKAGESSGPFRIDATNLIGKAASSTVEVEFLAIES
jgi:type 1 fimbria pilin